MTLLYESSGAGELNKPDNLTTGPGGDVFLCEDTGYDVPLPVDYIKPSIRAVTERGGIFEFARAESNLTEFAGVCFDAPRRTMYVNQQGDPRDGTPGVTYAIWGPWRKGRHEGALRLLRVDRHARLG
ncbi:MAG: alkaline phosphatase PhoX [Actinomycetota bacterium]